jgi:hypothetical protein
MDTHIHSFTPGQVVRLRSGGPAMTVTGLHGAKNIELAFATADTNISVLVLPATALEEVDWSKLAGHRVFVEGTVVHSMISPGRTYIDFGDSKGWVPTTAVRLA